MYKFTFSAKAAMASAMLLASTVSASADFQMTHWGMSPEELRSILPVSFEVEDEAKFFTPYEGIEVAGPLSGWGAPGTAIFHFTPEEGLQRVFFQADSAMDCEATIKGISTSYTLEQDVEQPPVESVQSKAVMPGGSAEIHKWRLEGAGDYVEVFHAKSTPEIGDPGTCAAMFSPISISEKFSE